MIPFRRYVAHDHKRPIIKPIEATPALHIQLVLYPRRGPNKDFAVILMFGRVLEGADGSRVKGVDIARIDSWHNRLHIDIDYADSRSEKYWLMDLDFTAEEFRGLPLIAETYFRKNWKVFLKEYVSQQEGFTPPLLSDLADRR